MANKKTAKLILENHELNLDIITGSKMKMQLTLHL